MVVETQCTDPFPPNARISDALREATNSRTVRLLKHYCTSER